MLLPIDAGTGYKSGHKTDTTCCARGASAITSRGSSAAPAASAVRDSARRPSTRHKVRLTGTKGADELNGTPHPFPKNHLTRQVAGFSQRDMFLPVAPGPGSADPTPARLTGGKICPRPFSSGKDSQPKFTEGSLLSSQFTFISMDIFIYIYTCMKKAPQWRNAQLIYQRLSAAAAEY